MLQRIFLNVLLLSFLVGYAPYIKGWDISQNVGQKISKATSDPYEFLSYAVPLGFLSYLLYFTFSKYNCSLDHLNCKEQIITPEKFLNFPEDSYKEILKFIRTECKRAGHPKPEKIEIMLYEENMKKDVSRYPNSFSAMKTPKYDLIVLSDIDYFHLEKIFAFRHGINAFRKQLFYACLCMSSIFNPKDEGKRQYLKFLKSILYDILVDNKKTSDNPSRFNSSCDHDYLIWIEDAEKTFNAAKYPNNCEMTKKIILNNLNKIAYMSDEYLDSCIEKILDMWAAAIHHESVHL